MSVPSPVPGITVLETLAYGGFAVVYRARQESVGREVALKVDNRLAHDERDRRRFLREAHAAGQLSDHPNVISIYDAGITSDGRPYLVMELCLGGSLAERIRKKGPMRAPEVRDIGVKIADALQCAHEAGVLHRDVKPANVLVNRFGAPGLADFGMAASFEGTQQMSATLEALTPAFAPPEVFRHEVPTVAVDVYALAATLYCLLSGRPPRWPVDGHPSIATIIGLQDAPILEVPGVPTALTAVLRRSLAPVASDRHPSAAAFRDALQGVALEAPTGMFTIPAGSGSSHRSLESAAAAVEEPQSGRAARRQGGRHLSAVSGAAHSSAVVLSAPAEHAHGSVDPVGLRARAAEHSASRAETRQLEAETRRHEAAPEPVVEDTGSPRRSAGPAPAWPVDHPAPRRSPALGRTPRLAVAAIAAAAVLGMVVAYAVNTQSRPQELVASTPSGSVVGPPIAASEVPAPSAAPSAAPRQSAAASKPPAQQPPPRIRVADPEVITGVGLGPFRVGEPARPLLQASLARHPDSDDPCRADEQLLATDARYREQFQTLSAHTVDGRIAHVTVFSARHRARGGLRIGSSILDITTAAPQAQQFGGAAPSFLVLDSGGAVLFVVRNGAVMAVVAGTVEGLTGIAVALGKTPDDISTLC